MSGLWINSEPHALNSHVASVRILLSSYQELSKFFPLPVHSSEFERNNIEFDNKYSDKLYACSGKAYL